jgi:hypothetical protein
MTEIRPSGKLPPRGVIIGSLVVLLGIILGAVGALLGWPAGLTSIAAGALFIVGLILFARAAFRQQG